MGTDPITDVLWRRLAGLRGRTFATPGGAAFRVAEVGSEELVLAPVGGPPLMRVGRAAVEAMLADANTAPARTLLVLDDGRPVRP